MTLDMPWHRVHIENFVHYIILSLLLFLLLTVGYTMTDIRYKWNDGLNSVQISSDVSLPQFKVLGHRQKIIEAELSTGKLFFHIIFYMSIIGLKNVVIFQATTLVCLARSSSCARWAITSSRSISPPVSSSSYLGSHSGSTGVPHQLEWVLGWLLCSPWPPSWPPLTRPCQKYPTWNPLTFTWALVSSWSLLHY